MPSEQESESKVSRYAGILLRPSNLLKTVASQFPLASIPMVMLDQIEGQEADDRLLNLESRVDLVEKLKAVEGATSPMPYPSRDWPASVAEFTRRTVDVAVAYDGGFHDPARRGHELFLVVGHACVVGEQQVLTCKEVVELAGDIARHRSGRVIIIASMAWYGCTFEPASDPSGLSVSRLLDRDEARFRQVLETWRKAGLGELVAHPPTSLVKFSVTPWIGQEIGFIHSGEAENVMRGIGESSRRQFDTNTISHFRLPSDDGLKTFVTGVLPGRFLHAGAPVFSRDGVLLGVLSDAERYKSDAGRRAVVRSLLGCPYFMPWV